MPVRDAVRRLVAERALEINPINKRLSVPSLTRGRLEQLSMARLCIEPELAARAVAKGDRRLVQALREIDGQLNRAIAAGDVDRYMAQNHAFHFALYAKADAEVLHAMAEGLWLQIGPFMRVVFGRIGTLGLSRDHHAEAIEHLAAGDAEGVRREIAADIADGMEAMQAAAAG
jgi:DNA-binding GntR family transcriptional regulator